MKRFDMYVIIAVVVITGLLFTTFAYSQKIILKLLFL